MYNIKKYLDKFKPFEVLFKTNENGLVLPYIYSERFIASPITHLSINRNTKFHEYPEELKTLFNVTYNDNVVMSSYTNGEIKSVEKFEYFINKQSFRWQHKYPFAAFIIQDKSNNNIVGLELLGNADNELGFVNETANVSYMFNKDYHGKGVGYECIGALILGYAQYLFEHNTMINQIFNEQNNKFEEGTILTKLEASVREDNIASSKILINLGFNHLYNFNKDGCIKYKYQYILTPTTNDDNLEVLGSE